MNHEPRYVRLLRGFMHVADPTFWDGMVLGLAIAAGIFIAVIYFMGW